VKVTWRPFFLRPDMPPEGKPKGPGPRVGDRLRQAGLSAGIDFTGKTDRAPNSTEAHTLLDWTLEKHGAEKQHQLQEVLFRHYFTDGRYPDAANLRSAAEEVGLDGTAAEAALGDTMRQGTVRQEGLSYSQQGVSGVPFFVIGGQPAFSGAQPPAVFVDELRRAAK